MMPALVLAAWLAGGQALPAARADSIVAVRVHGNHTTPDAEVLRLAGVAVGQLFTEDVALDAAVRLRDTGRFRRVDVRKRYGSLDDPGAVVLVILVEEKPGISMDEGAPGPLRRIRAGTMWMPILGFEDGYGFTYGARVSFVDVLGASLDRHQQTRGAARQWRRPYLHLRGVLLHPARPVPEPRGLGGHA